MIIGHRLWCTGMSTTLWLMRDYLLVHFSHNFEQKPHLYVCIFDYGCINHPPSSTESSKSTKQPASQPDNQQQPNCPPSAAGWKASYSPFTPTIMLQYCCSCPGYCLSIYCLRVVAAQQLHVARFFLGSFSTSTSTSGKLLSPSSSLSTLCFFFYCPAITVIIIKLTAMAVVGL